MVHCAALAKPSPTAISDHSSGEPGKMPLQPAEAMGKQAGRCSLPLSPGTCAERGRRNQLCHGAKMLSRYHFARAPLTPLTGRRPLKQQAKLHPSSTSHGEINVAVSIQMVDVSICLLSCVHFLQEKSNMSVHVTSAQ